MNYKKLIYFVEKRDLSRRQTRYLNILFEFNIKIVYRLDSQNIKVDALIRIFESRLTNSRDNRLKQQYQIILTPNRLKLNNIDINEINNSIYYRVLKINKDNKFYNNIRDAIIEDFIKYQSITLSKCFI